jgi:hypothetical protein
MLGDRSFRNGGTECGDPIKIRCKFLVRFQALDEVASFAAGNYVSLNVADRAILPINPAVNEPAGFIFSGNVGGWETAVVTIVRQ